MDDPKAAFLREVFESERVARELLRRRFEELEAYSSTLPGLPHPLFRLFTSPPLARKNRYRLILPMSDARVRLKMIAQNGGGSSVQKVDAVEKSMAIDEYINANYITPRFIATQAPLKSTVADFWRMIWGENVQCIVMLVRIQPRKADCYWPLEGETLIFAGGLALTATSKAEFLVIKDKMNSGVIRREFRLQSGDQCRMITHFQYEGWPDHGVPCSFEEFHTLRKILSGDPAYTHSPVVIHCSAGVGRTGTFITIDSVLGSDADCSNGCTDKDTAENADPILKFIKNGRHHRQWFVETEEQFIFVYEYVYWCITRHRGRTIDK